MISPIVSITDVFFSYKGHSAIQGASMDIPQGEFVVMIGPNGGGKTTLLKLMLGMLKPDKGTIRVLGAAPAKASRHVGYVPQDGHANQDFPITVIDVVMMGALGSGKKRAGNFQKNRREALVALDQMGMADFWGKRIGEISGGQRQRALIARALVTKPELLLLDEPTASLDARGEADFFRLLKELNKEITIVVVSHDFLAISRYVKSVACVNKNLHYHHEAEITGEMMACMYPGTPEDRCPVEIVAHGLPHRVLKGHGSVLE